MTNNDSTKEISFEINIQGEFEFFKEEILESDFEVEQCEEEEYLKQTDIPYTYNNIFDLFTGLGEGEEEHLCNKDFNFSCNISFAENEKNYNLKSYKVCDHINKFELQFNFDTNFGDIIARKFNCLDDKSVSVYFKTYLDYDCLSMDKYKPFLLKLLPSSLGWNYSSEVNLEHYYKVLKFCYIVKRIIPESLTQFLSVNRLTAVRELIKPYYFIDANSSYLEKEYYELLKSIVESQNIIFKPGEDLERLKDSFRECMRPNFKSKYEDLLHVYEIDKKGKQVETLIHISYDDVTSKNVTFLHNTYLYILINYYLNKFDFKFIIFIESNKNIREVTLISENGKFNASASSSGFMQVFPIIINCCNIIEQYYNKINENNSTVIKYKDKDNDNLVNIDKYYTLLIEQPELHLHPKLQSLLAELFADTSKGSSSENTVFIETHSEHLIRKLQVLIANGELDREKVSVLYFDNKDNKDGSTKVEEMKIDEKGLFIKDWPDGFFDDSINLTMELYEALRKRGN